MSYAQDNTVLANQEPVKYCKHGYFCWGKIWQKCLQDLSRGGYFHNTTPISFINKSFMGFIFVLRKFLGKRQYCENVNITPTRKFSHLQKGKIPDHLIILC